MFRRWETALKGSLKELYKVLPFSAQLSFFKKNFLSNRESFVESRPLFNSSLK